MQRAAHYSQQPEAMTKENSIMAYRKLLPVTFAVQGGFDIAADTAVPAATTSM
jgi:hypothetical protein